MRLQPLGSSRGPGAPSYRLIILPWLRRPGSWLLMPSWLAITIGRWVFAWRPLDEAELAHEQAHLRQWRENGLRFAWRYLAESRRAARAGGDRYRDNRFEMEARAAADAVRGGQDIPTLDGPHRLDA